MENKKSNDILISCAPEMLETLIEVIRFYHYDYENFEYMIENKIKPLIEKATGKNIMEVINDRHTKM